MAFSGEPLFSDLQSVKLTVGQKFSGEPIFSGLQVVKLSIERNETASEVGGDGMFPHNKFGGVQQFGTGSIFSPLRFS